MEVVLGFEAFDAQMYFIGLMLSAPLPAAIMGGLLADAWGGYKGEGMPNALTLNIIFGICATIFSLLLSITFDKSLFLAFTWGFFFFGVAIMPIASGIIVGSVPKFAQNTASAVSCVCNNIFGLALGPVVSGHIMEQYKSKREGMIHGFIPLFVAGIFLVFLFVWARAIVRRHLKLTGRLKEGKYNSNAARGRSNTYDEGLSPHKLNIQESSQESLPVESPARPRSLTPM